MLLGRVRYARVWILIPLVCLFLAIGAVPEVRAAHAHRKTPVPVAGWLADDDDGADADATRSSPCLDSLASMTIPVGIPGSDVPVSISTPTPDHRSIIRAHVSRAPPRFEPSCPNPVQLSPKPPIRSLFDYDRGLDDYRPRTCGFPRVPED